MSFADEEIKKTLVDRLGEDRRLDFSDIHVEVERGKVILKGSAETYQTSALAQEDAAAVTGVKEVVNRIVVDPAEKIAPPTDEAIRARIQATLSLESELIPADLVLAVADGTVFIDGFVETLQEKRRVDEIANRERGVLEVLNNLTVVPGQVKSNEHLTERIQAALIGDELGDIKSVRVYVEQGVATLTGTVASLESRRRVNDAVASVSGVLDVRDDLVVTGGIEDSAS